MSKTTRRESGRCKAPPECLTARCAKITAGQKEGQETVLAVEIARDGFEWALRHACLSHHEHGLRLQPLSRRSLQLGLAGEAARLYADEWTVSVTDTAAVSPVRGPVGRTGHGSRGDDRSP